MYFLLFIFLLILLINHLFTFKREISNEQFSLVPLVQNLMSQICFYKLSTLYVLTKNEQYKF